MYGYLNVSSDPNRYKRGSEDPKGLAKPDWCDAIIWLAIKNELIY